MTGPDLHKSIILRASRETVWSFLTDRDKLATWFHPAREDLSGKAPYSLTKQNETGERESLIWGEVLEWDPPARLVMTFEIGAFEGANTTLTWELEEIAGGTRLTLTHTGIVAAAGGQPLGLLMALDAGWDEHLHALRKAASQ